MTVMTRTAGSYDPNTHLYHTWIADHLCSASPGICRCQPFAFPTFPNPPTISGEKKLIHTPNKNPPEKTPSETAQKNTW